MDWAYTVFVESAVWICLLVLCYGISLRIASASQQHVLLHPIVVTTILLLVLTQIIEPDVARVMGHLDLVQWLLGPLTVGLALPVYKQLPVLRRMGIKVVLPIMVGGIFAPLSAWSVLYFLGTDVAWQMTMLTKSITTPFAMDTATMLGGIAGLAAVFNIVTGVIVVMTLPMVNHILRIHGDQASGLMLGVLGHGIGTSKAVLLSEQAGAFASLALCVNGVVTAMALSFLFG